MNSGVQPGDCIIALRKVSRSLDEERENIYLLETKSSSLAYDEITDNTGPSTKAHRGDGIRVSTKLGDVGAHPIGGCSGVPKAGVGLDVFFFTFRGEPAEGSEPVVGG